MVAPPGVEPYQPASRRPIAGAFRKTAGAAVAACVRVGIHPDAISCFSMVAAAAAAICFWQSRRWPVVLLGVAPLFCYLRLWLNMLDGMVALASHTASRRGEILNDLPDRISDVLIFVGVAHSGWCNPFSGYWAAIFALLTAYVGTLGQAVGARRNSALGWQTGFDSGQTLDYVYRNQPAGLTPLGRLIDRQYLNSIGWAGIRIRKTHLKQALHRAIAQLRSEGQPMRIVDIAGGGGRYLLEVLSELEPTVAAEALIRDRSREALLLGQRTAEQMNLANVRFIEGDAFDADSLAAIAPTPTLAIVSGLYELFGDNTRISQSLAGLARVLPIGGYLIYTNQPWHPQIEMIARVLINRDQQPWVMRRRTQAEMDALVRHAGFEKREMRIDPHGIFTVSLAQRVPQ